ncbi:unnamed protein product [Lactuca saligna]|uniref:Protein kinase domain-containing protein n=1 Tax=Lactuca saligna TaxID=75948 RepID=A0AA35ZK66_LACSI|nr:unnamed protein product [Lactuca saligna]
MSFRSKLQLELLAEHVRSVRSRKRITTVNASAANLGTLLLIANLTIGCNVFPTENTSKKHVECENCCQISLFTTKNLIFHLFSSKTRSKTHFYEKHEEQTPNSFSKNIKKRKIFQEKCKNAPDLAKEIDTIQALIPTSEEEPPEKHSTKRTSPAAPPIPSIPASMADFTSGTEIDITKHQHSSSRKVLIGLITVLSVMAIIIVSLMCLWICHRKNIHKSRKIGTTKLDSLRGLPLSSFVSRTNSVFKTKIEKGSVVVMDYNVLESATNNFGESEILGVGGFGCVYNARLDDNLHVAVKRLDGISQDAIKEFQESELIFDLNCQTIESQNWDRHLNQIHAKGILGKIPGTSPVHETSHVTILIPMKILKHSGSGNDKVMNEGSMMM